MTGKKLADTFESIENDLEASVRSRGMAKAKRLDELSNTTNKVVKEWYELEGPYVRKRTKMSNGNVYSKHICKATSQNLEKLKTQGIEVQQRKLV